MATATPRLPSVFDFLKEGLILPTRNRSLFTPILALTVAYIAIGFLTSYLAVEQLATDVFLNLDAVRHTFGEGAGRSSTHVKHPGVLVAVVATYLIAKTVVNWAVRAVTVSAAVVTYSGERLTVRELLCKRNLRGPLVTAALADVAIIACVGAVSVLALLFLWLLVLEYSSVLILLDVVLVVVGSAFPLYLGVVCHMAVVVSVAETGCNASCALGRAWQLAAGEKARAVVFIQLAMCLAAGVVSLFSMVAGALGLAGAVTWSMYMILSGAVQVVFVCTITAYYYECSEQADVKHGHGYDMVATWESA